MFSIVGSRDLSWDYGFDVAGILFQLDSVSVGDCKGADAMVLESVAAGYFEVSNVHCFSIMNQQFKGGISATALRHVHSFQMRGGRISWMAGGKFSIPIAARLSMRTRAVVSAGSDGCVAFLSSPSSVGSVAALRFANSLGFPCFAVPCGFPASDLPSLGVGSWVASPVFSGAFVWVADLGGLF